MVSAAETVNETAEKEAFKTRAIDGEGEGSDLEAHDAPEEAFAARALASKLDGFLEHVLRRAWRAAGEDAALLYDVVATAELDAARTPPSTDADGCDADALALMALSRS